MTSPEIPSEEYVLENFTSYSRGIAFWLLELNDRPRDEAGRVQAFHAITAMWGTDLSARPEILQENLAYLSSVGATLWGTPAHELLAEYLRTVCGETQDLDLLAYEDCRSVAERFSADIAVWIESIRVSLWNEVASTVNEWRTACLDPVPDNAVFMDRLGDQDQVPEIEDADLLALDEGIAQLKKAERNLADWIAELGYEEVEELVSQGEFGYYGDDDDPDTLTP